MLTARDFRSHLLEKLSGATTVESCPKVSSVPPRKNNPVRTSSKGSRSPFAKKKARLVRRVAQGALLAVSFTAMQFFIEDSTDSKRLFDRHMVDNLRAPLTHYHE